MERLTELNKKGDYVVFDYLETRGEFKVIVDKLAEYEDTNLPPAERQKGEICR